MESIRIGSIQKTIKAHSQGNMGFPEKAYDRLYNLYKRWGISQEDVYYAIENGLLRTCVWMPLRVVEKGTIHDKKFVYSQYEQKEGFMGVRPEDFHRICSTGVARLRIFKSVRSEGYMVRLAYEPPQPALSVRLNDLVVLREDRAKFEAAYEITASNLELVKGATTPAFVPSPDYHHIVVDGTEYHFGDVQARILEQLHDAAQSRTEWVHGKTLLHVANSRALRLRDVFKSKSNWQEIIESNGRGSYRLKIAGAKRQHMTFTAAAMSVLMYLQDLLDFVPDCAQLLCTA